MPTEQCVFLILYIHSIYGILYMYITIYTLTKYGCVFLKLGENIYVAMDVIPILLGSLPLAHNAQHSLVIGQAGASPPSRTNSMIFLYIGSTVRRAQNLLRASFSPIFLRRKCYTRFFFSGISIFRNLRIRTYVCICICKTSA